MTDDRAACRTALLARPGAACDRLREVLAAVDRQPVLEADPTRLDLQALVQADPQLVLIALDAAVEDSLERFDAVLGDPGIDVIYEDADLAATREGWDAARWQRHLVAKLRGHGDVLPPAPDRELAEVAARPHAASATAAATAEPVVQRATSFGELTLDDDDAGCTVSSENDSRDRFVHDMSELEQRISTMELVDDSPAQGPEQARGAVLLLAGLGGPDAVRQLLGALPVGFARPVLVQQRLDGGRYDKLVAQMQRATALPVELARSGQAAMAGNVYILSDEIGMDPLHGGPDAQLRFNDTGNDVLAALPAADSAIVLLSGSNPEHVDAAMNHGWSGALVAAQAAEGCYDAAAANALAARGGESGTPVELASRLSGHWPAAATATPGTP